MNDAEVRRCIEQVEGLLADVEDDPRAVAALQGVVDLYGEALRRIAEAGALTGGLVEDELVSHLLLLHDLHPEAVEARVTRALDEVRPYLGSHGGGVELLSVVDGVAHLRLDGTCDGCPSSAITLKHAIEEAVLRAAPELDGVEADGAGRQGGELLQVGRLAAPPGPCLPEAAR